MTTQLDAVYAIADQYTGDGAPFIFLGQAGPRLIGHALARDVRLARPVLDAKLQALGLSATYLSTFKTPNGSIGYLAHS